MKKSLWVVCVLLVVLLAGLLFVEQKTKNEKIARLEFVNQNSALYEEKLASLKAELEEKRAEYEKTEASGFVCVAAKVSSADDFYKVSSWVDEYDYPLTVIINTTTPLNAVSPILRAAAADGNQCIMYCGSTYDWVENTEDMDAVLSQNNLSQCGVAYFDYAASYSQIAAAESSGMRGYSNPFTSSDAFNSETNAAEGMYCLGHFLLSDASSFSNVADAAAETGKSFILAIDMNELDISFNENSAKQTLESLNSYIEDGSLQAVSVDECVIRFDEGYDTRQSAKAEFEAYESQTLSEISELEAALAEMYAIIE